MRRIKFKKYAGFRIRGTIQINQEGRDTLLQRASWLTAMVEAGGKFGCVVNFDGTGMTAGLHQAIAVYPKSMGQGPLWGLLGQMQAVIPDDMLWTQIFEQGWYITRDGALRSTYTGGLIPGIVIRTALSGRGGVVAESGYRREQAELWVQIFHEAFTRPETFGVQEQFGVEWFKRQLDKKLRFAKSKEDKIHSLNDYLQEPPLQDDFELAICMYLSHSINAPGMALRVLCRSLSIKDPEERGWAAHLIRLLGNTKYGRWDDDLKNGRYQRTRRHALRSGFWPRYLFVGKNAIMPVNLPG